MSIINYKVNNIDFGFKIYKNIFDSKKMNIIENLFNNNFDWNFHEDKKHHYFPKYTFKNNIKNIHSGLCKREILHDICNVCNCHMMIDTNFNNNIPKWIQENIIKELVDNNIIPNQWANCITIIMYKDTKLNPHFDSPHIFELPIISLKLFNDTIISFDEKYDIIQNKGDISVMNGLSATQYNHSIKKINNNKSVSIIIRRIHPQLLNHKWITNNCLLL
jgi:hypothetical protein